MRIAYDGTNFHGWQFQPGLRTVQELLEQTCRRVVRHPLHLTVSGRTDSGVHAASQMAHFDTTCPIPTSNLGRAIGSRLPDDLAILSVEEVQPNFHASYDAQSKLYRYRLYHSPRRPVEQLCQRYVYHIWKPLDIDRMRQAAADFVGEKDFAAVAARSGADRKSTIRTVLRCEVVCHGNEIHIDVEGTGFLYNQVRNMTGTLVQIGRGFLPADCIPDILASKDRAYAGPTMSPAGLCLQWVRYPAHMLRPPEREIDPVLACSEDGP